MADQLASDFPLIATPSGRDVINIMRNGVLKTAYVDTLQQGSVKAYGARGDGKIAWSNASMTISSAVLTSPTTPFTTDDVGKLVVVEGAGVSGATLVTTILNRLSATQATLVTAASTSVSNVLAVWASNDNAYIQDALDNNYRVYFPSGIYGITDLRLRSGHQLIFSGIDTCILARMGLGGGGEAIGMTAGEVAQKVLLTDFSLYCNQIGTDNDGLALGTEGNLYAFANGSWLDNIRVLAASGCGININSNGGKFGQLWIQNFAGLGTPDALSRPNTIGFASADTTLYGSMLSVEGRFEDGDVYLGAGGGDIHRLQLEPTGDYPTKDLVTFTATGQSVRSIFIATGGATRRDITRIENGVQAIHLRFHWPNAALPITATNLINDLNCNVVIPYSAPLRSFVAKYESDFYNQVVYDDQFKHRIEKRFSQAIGPTVTAANSLTLGKGGNTFFVNGSTQINAITTADWPSGSIIHLIFNDSPLVKYNTAGAAGTAVIWPSGDVSLQCFPNTVLTLMFDSVRWQQVCPVKHPYAGSFTPTLAITDNLTTVTPYPVQYRAEGDTVVVCGQVDVTPTASGAMCAFTMTLPIASTFTQPYQAGGMGVGRATTVSGMVAAIFASTGGKVTFQFSGIGTSLQVITFQFMYQIVN